MQTSPITATLSISLQSQRCPSPVVESTYSTRKVPTLNGPDLPMGVYIPREEGDFLYSMVRQFRPAITIEVGMANGLSTVFIAEALRENGVGRHIAIDPFQHSDWHGAAIALIRKAGLESYVELMELFSHQALPELERKGIIADFAFIDGSHLFDYVMTDFLCVDRILKPGGLIAFDDSDWPAIRQALRYIVANRHYEVAFPEINIENEWNHPSFSARFIRRIGKSIPKLGNRFRPDFMRPDAELGLRGRCVVLRKLKADDRDSQTKFHMPF